MPSSDPFIEAFDHVVGIEGKYSDNPADSGGQTMYGITERVARAHGYVGDMRNLSLGVAQAIYREQYWNLLKLDDIALISKGVALELFDTAVNCGVGAAGKFLQRALNVFNRQGRDYADVTVDGVVGPMTVDAMRRFYKTRGYEADGVLMNALNALQGVRYIEIAEQRPKDEEFEFGWFKNRVAIA